MNEEWKPVIWYEWRYQVSNIGKVKSLNYKRTWKIKILNPTKDWHYSRVRLWKLKKNIHRLVAIHFIENPFNLPCVLHKKEDLDERWFLYNWVDNIYWGTYSDNAKDRENKWRWNKINFPWKWKFWKDHNCCKIINQYSIQWEFIREWGSIFDAYKLLWIDRTNISKCCNNRIKTAGGFIWKFKNI